MNRLNPKLHNFFTWAYAILFCIIIGSSHWFVEFVAARQLHALHFTGVIFAFLIMVRMHNTRITRQLSTGIITSTFMSTLFTLLPVINPAFILSAKCDEYEAVSQLDVTITENIEPGQWNEIRAFVICKTERDYATFLIVGMIGIIILNLLTLLFYGHYHFYNLR